MRENRTSGRVAVLIPCCNEAVAVASVIAGFRKALPDATVYVYDNNSKDCTKDIAAKAGAIVRLVVHPGKGNVVRRMFADIDADVYVLVDGDDTYDVGSAPAMIEKLLTEQLDMVVGCRKSEQIQAYRLGHRLGNRILTGFVAVLFGRQFNDILSGYRVFSNRFVKSFPALATGFETEAELTIHALELRMPVGEIDTLYKCRPEGSTSKLNTYRDGLRILLTVTRLFRLERPVWFYSILAVLFLLSSIGLGIPLLSTYLATGLVPRFPTAILAASLAVLGSISFATGLILDTVTLSRQELRRLAYLAYSAPTLDNAPSLRAMAVRRRSQAAL
jgi:glycosyltransferase involved in cell wall biosynthesis